MVVSVSVIIRCLTLHYASVIRGVVKMSIVFQGRTSTLRNASVSAIIVCRIFRVPQTNISINIYVVALRAIAQQIQMVEYVDPVLALIPPSVNVFERVLAKRRNVKMVTTGISSCVSAD